MDSGSRRSKLSVPVVGCFGCLPDNIPTLSRSLMPNIRLENLTWIRYDDKCLQYSTVDFQTGNTMEVKVGRAGSWRSIVHKRFVGTEKTKEKAMQLCQESQ